MALDQVIIEYDIKLDKLKSGTKELEGSLKKVEDKSKQAGDAGSKAFEKTSTSAKGLLGNLNGIAGKMGIALGVGTILAAGKAIIDTTASFQRFEAVLTNTLGSSSKAQEALKMIQDFAAKTPFSVEELTASFVKLANQGFVPTAEEMRKLGDLAASQGKTFDMLTEAIIDAQTGEFERLKEFGIRASKEGDNVKFSFKGVETQTKFTNEAIRNYILGLGDLQGVSGGMAAISETLGGKLSNLGDSLQQLANTIGSALSPALSSIIGFASDGIAFLGDFVSYVTNGFRSSVEEDIDSVKASFEELQAIAQKSFQFSDLSKASIEDLKKFKEEAVKNLQEFQKQFKDINTENSLPAQRLRDIEAELKKKIELEQKAKEEASKPKELTDKEKDALRKKIEKETKERQKIERELLLKQAGDNEATKLKLKAQFEIEDFEGNASQKKQFKEAVETQLEKDLSELTLKIGIDKIEDKAGQSLEDKLQEKAKQIQPVLDLEVEANKEKNERIREDDKKLAEDQEEIKRAAFEASVALTNTLFEFGSTLRDAEIDELEKKKERGLISEDQFAKGVAEIKRKQAEADKAQALFNIAIATAENIVKYVGGLPATAPLLALAVATGAIQAGIVLAKPIPEFAEGVVKYKGAGTETSDSNLVKISRGESIITAKGTNYGLAYLEALNEGPEQFKKLIYAKDILPALRAQENKFRLSTADSLVNSMKYQSQFDDYNMIRAIKGNKIVKLDNETVMQLGRYMKPKRKRSV